MYTIGEFSRITSLTIKALRFYHEQDILVPEKIAAETGYRLYGPESLDKAFQIHFLKDAGFSLSEIKLIFQECREEGDLSKFLRKKWEEAESKIRDYKKIETRLKVWEEQIRSSQVKENYEIHEITIEDYLIAAIRMKGDYSQIGEAFGILFKKVGRLYTGKNFALYYDLEYKENDADFEACFQVIKKINVEGVDFRTLKGGRMISLLHKGPYGTQGKSYAKLFEYCREKNLTAKAPIREIYHKGPGMLFKGNPDKYLTEIQLAVD